MKQIIKIPMINIPPKISPERISPPGTFVNLIKRLTKRETAIIPNNILRLRSFIIAANEQGFMQVGN